MSKADYSSRLTDQQLDQVKHQLTPVMARMTRLQIFEMADFLYAEARRRHSSASVEDWRFEINV